MSRSTEHRDYTQTIADVEKTDLSDLADAEHIVEGLRKAGPAR